MEKESDKTFILNLIRNVEKKKCLYDKRDAFYYNRNAKERAWREVAGICGADCKHRWKLLRERFCKELKKMEGPSGSGLNYLEEWIFMQPMMFLKGFLAPRRTCNNVQEHDTDSILEQSVFIGDSLLDPLISTTPSLPKKSKTTLDSLYQKFGETIENIEKSFISPPEQNTADEAFVKIVVCLMKDLPVPVKDEFQASMLQELYRLRRDNRNTNS